MFVQVFIRIKIEFSAQVLKTKKVGIQPSSANFISAGFWGCWLHRSAQVSGPVA